MIRKFKVIGSVGVDSGTLIVGDPCYLTDDKFPDELGDDKPGDLSYDGMGAMFDNPEGPFAQLQARDSGRDAVVFSTAYGDGSYPIVAIFGEGWGGHEIITQVIVDTDPEYDENDEYKLPAWVKVD